MDSLFDDSNIFLNNSYDLPVNFGEIQAKKDLEEFKKNLISSFNTPNLEEDIVEELLNSDCSE